MTRDHHKVHEPLSINEHQRERLFMATIEERNEEACDRLLELLCKHHPEHERPVKRDG